MMNLILWRHAEAEAESASGKDADRILTRRGRKDADKMAKWLNRHLPADTVVLASPASRCLQTAAALHDLNHMEIKVADFLSVNSTVERIAKAIANMRGTETVLIVGHQPNLGLLIAMMLGLDQTSCCEVKKGAVWWLRQRTFDETQGYRIHTVQLPKY